MRKKRIYLAALLLALSACIVTGCGLAGKGSGGDDLKNVSDLIEDEDGAAAEELMSGDAAGAFEELSEASSESAAIVEIPLSEETDET